MSDDSDSSCCFAEGVKNTGSATYGLPSSGLEKTMQTHLDRLSGKTPTDPNAGLTVTGSFKQPWESK